MPQGNNNRRRALRNAMLQRVDIVAELWRKNYTYKEIAEEVKRRLGLKTCSASTICTDVQRLLAEWKEQRLEDMDAKVTAELARIDLVIKEAWAMWEKSKEDRHRKKSKQTGVPTDSNGNVSMLTIRAIMEDAEVRGVGEPRYLDIILRALAQRCKLLGLDKTAVDVTAGIQGALTIRYVDAGVPCATSEEEVRRRNGLT